MLLAQAELIAAAEGAGLPGTLKSELFASALELNTGVCASAAEGAATLAELRRGAARLAEERGLRLAAAGSHPFSRAEEQEIADDRGTRSSSLTRASRLGGKA